MSRGPFDDPQERRIGRAVVDTPSEENSPFDDPQKERVGRRIVDTLLEAGADKNHSLEMRRLADRIDAPRRLVESAAATLVRSELPVEQMGTGKPRRLYVTSYRDARAFARQSTA